MDDIQPDVTILLCSKCRGEVGFTIHGGTIDLSEIDLPTLPQATQFSEQDRQVDDGSGDEETQGGCVHSGEKVHACDVPNPRGLSREDLEEELARTLCNTYYLTVDPLRPMTNAFDKITSPTQAHWRNQAQMMVEQGWVKMPTEWVDNSVVI